jgi:hypothetical protein
MLGDWGCANGLLLAILIFYLGERQVWAFWWVGEIWRTAPKGRGKPRPLDSRPVGDRSLSPTPPWQVSGLILSDTRLRSLCGHVADGCATTQLCGLVAR